MGSPARALAPEVIKALADARTGGTGGGLEAAERLGPSGVIDEITAAGLRGRGGAGFPTGRKWAAVAGNASPTVPATVVVNAAEGEPGSFKDRAILRRDPYRVLEGALIAARTVGADNVVIALKRSFEEEIDRIRRAVAEVDAEGWSDGVELLVYEGPTEYLFGEETALLEAIDGRGPFPRVTPPYRHGVEEVGPTGAVDTADPETPSAADVQLAAPGEASDAPPTLVNNVETMANVPGIVARGADWFRELGTDQSPGTVVVTITGRTRRHGVEEVPMGTPLREVIDRVGGGARPGRRVTAALSGVANPFLTNLDTPLTYEAMEAAGSGLGAAGFIVFDDASDLVAVAQGASRFLAIESCGQCTPCKEDGLALAELLDRVRRSDAQELDLAGIEGHVATVTDGARCFLAHQHQRVVESVLRECPETVRAHVEGAEPADAELVAAIVDIVDGEAVLDTEHLSKQPDWSYDDTPSGRMPAERFHVRQT